MGRLVAFGALALGAYLVFGGGKLPTASTSGGGGSGFSSYTGASKPAISGIAAAAGG